MFNNNARLRVTTSAKKVNKKIDTGMPTTTTKLTATATISAAKTSSDLIAAATAEKLLKTQIKILKEESPERSK